MQDRNKFCHFPAQCTSQYLLFICIILCNMSIYWLQKLKRKFKTFLQGENTTAKERQNDWVNDHENPKLTSSNWTLLTVVGTISHGAWYSQFPNSHTFKTCIYMHFFDARFSLAKELKETKYITKQMTTPFQSKQIAMGQTWSFTRPFIKTNSFSNNRELGLSWTSEVIMMTAACYLTTIFQFHKSSSVKYTDRATAAGRS
jgi:cell division protein FtsL